MDLGAVPERSFSLGRQRKSEAAPRSQMARSGGNLRWAGYGTHAGRHAAARQCRRKPLGFCVILVGRVCTALAQGAGVLVGCTWIAGSTTSLRLARTVGNSDARFLSRW